MTNNKMSLGEKVGVGMAIVGLAGVVGFIGSVFYDNAKHPIRYPTLHNERKIVYEVERLNSSELLLNDEVLSKKHSDFREEYAGKLESKLTEIRASPEYSAETEKNKEEENKNKRNGRLMILSILLYGAGMIYGIRESKKRGMLEYKRIYEELKNDK